jgi:hypothetical protein
LTCFPCCLPPADGLQEQTGARPFYVWDASKPGSDLIGAAASALSAISLVFKGSGEALHGPVQRTSLQEVQMRWTYCTPIHACTALSVGAFTNRQCQRA